MYVNETSKELLESGTVVFIFILYFFLYINTWFQLFFLAQLAGTVEFTNCISAEEKDSSNEFPGYDTKQSDAEVPVMLKLWEMPITSLLRSLQGPHWSGVVAPDKVQSMGQIEANCNYAKLNCLKLTVFPYVA